jgi:spermidine synthase
MTVTIFLVYIAIANTFVIKQAYSTQLIDTDTNYGRVWIYESQELGDRPVRLMVINNEFSSGMYLDKEDELVFDYTKYYQLAEVFKPDFNKTLLIGGAGYSYPKFYLKTYPQAYIDVVEIDPEVTELARIHFGLKDHANLRIFHEDGRLYLNREPDIYDVILGDAFRSNTVPFHLTTQETVRHMHNMLTESGVVIINLIGSLDGTKGEFIRASYHTYASIFPQVHLFSIQKDVPATALQNIILVASKSNTELPSKSNNPKLQSMLDSRWLQTIPQDIPILTDDFAPVEYYTRNILD